VFNFYSILVALVFVLASRAETIISQSQQFVVHYTPAQPLTERIPAGALEVVPELLVVTAERVKQALTAELPALADNRLQIHVGVVNSAGADSPVGISISRYSDGWRYEIAVPRVVEEPRLVKGFINVLMLEYANRGAERGAELPAWVTEGMMQQMMFTIGPKFVITRAPNAWETTARDLNFWTRETLRTNSTLSFQGLTTASVPARKSDGEALYLAGAHLLIRSLLELPDGRRRFAQFLQLLPRTWNWQTAFMQAFGFQRMLDVEKWWALTVIEFTTRDERQAWSAEMSLRKLDELLLTRVEFRAATNALPELRLVDLKSILGETDTTLQRQAIEERILQLNYTAPRMAPEVASLALAYKQALESFLKMRDGISVRTALRSTPAARQAALISEAIGHVGALDEKRRLLGERTVTAAR
jgi:hypothetical protein